MKTLSKYIIERFVSTSQDKSEKFKIHDIVYIKREYTKDSIVMFFEVIEILKLYDGDVLALRALENAIDSENKTKLLLKPGTPMRRNGKDIKLTATKNIDGNYMIDDCLATDTWIKNQQIKLYNNKPIEATIL